MKKELQTMVEAIRVTKRYTEEEVKKLSKLFLYLNDIEGLMDEYRYGVSAKGLWKLLNPLTKGDKEQRFDDWWESVSNISRLKLNEDYIEQNIVTSQKYDDTYDLSITENSVNDTIEKKKKVKWVIPIKDKDYILTLRAGEYCATLTKGDAGDLYRRFIFDIKDEFIRLVFRRGKSIATRNEFTKSISLLWWMQVLPDAEQSKIYAHLTNYVYQKTQSIGKKAIEYKADNQLEKHTIAKHYFTKEWLLDLEKIESKIAVIIEYNTPSSTKEIENIIDKFTASL